MSNNRGVWRQRFHQRVLWAQGRPVSGAYLAKCGPSHLSTRAPEMLSPFRHSLSKQYLERALQPHLCLRLALQRESLLQLSPFFGVPKCVLLFLGLEDYWSGRVPPMARCISTRLWKAAGLSCRFACCVNDFVLHWNLTPLSYLSSRSFVCGGQQASPTRKLIHCLFRQGRAFGCSGI